MSSCTPAAGAPTAASGPPPSASSAAAAKPAAGRFAGKTVLVTGGTSGIGAAAARLFAAEGATVAISGRRAALGEPLAAELGGLFIEADLADAAAPAAIVAATIAKYGRVDVLFNNAGVVLRGGCCDTSDADWAETMELNVTAAWRMMKAVVPAMKAQASGGAIVNNASDWGLVASPLAMAYCVSKAALIQLTKCVALEYSRDRIRVNAVCPGDTLVERWGSDGYFRGSGAVSKAEVAADGADLPIGRVASAAEVAKTVLFLASDDASYMTGSCLVVDGGNTAR